MRFRTVAVPAALAAVALSAPAGAQAATLTAEITKPCYGSGDAIRLAGSGFTPGRDVSVSFGTTLLRGRAPTDAAGGFTARATLPDLPEDVDGQTSSFTATDGVNSASSAPVRASDLDVTVNPDSGPPAGLRRIRAQGFTAGGSSLYAHVRRGGRTRTIRIGGLTGPCKTVNARRRLFRPRRFRTGSYRIHFDSSSRFNAEPAQAVIFTFRIFRRRRGLPGAASLEQSWTRVR